MPYFMWSGALERTSLLLSYPTTSLALHNTIILIITHLPTPKSLNQLINTGTCSTGDATEGGQRDPRGYHAPGKFRGVIRAISLY